jgi:hypothetical protein
MYHHACWDAGCLTQVVLQQTIADAVTFQLGGASWWLGVLGEAAADHLDPERRRSIDHDGAMKSRHRALCFRKGYSERFLRQQSELMCWSQIPNAFDLCENLHEEEEKSIADGPMVHGTVTGDHRQGVSQAQLFSSRSYELERHTIALIAALLTSNRRHCFKRYSYKNTQQSKGGWMMREHK